MVFWRQKTLPWTCCVLVSIGSAEAALAQGGRPCASSPPPSIGVAFGRSSPYLEGLDRGTVGLPAPGSVDVAGGVGFVGRVEVPAAGPLRLRIEGGTARWDVRTVTYDPERWTVTADTSVGKMAVSHLAALVGVRTGRAPVCAHVSAGAGFYSLGFRGASLRRPGAALAAGIELPAGEHGAIQVEAALHLIATGGSGFIASSTVPALNLLVGWAYRF